MFSIRSAGSGLPPPGTQRTAPPCKRTGGSLSYANSFTGPKISTPDAIIRVDYQNDGAIRIDETRVKLKRVVATGIAVKLSCAA